MLDLLEVEINKTSIRSLKLMPDLSKAGFNQDKLIYKEKAAFEIKSSFVFMYPKLLEDLETADNRQGLHLALCCVNNAKDHENKRNDPDSAGNNEGQE